MLKTSQSSQELDLKAGEELVSRRSPVSPIPRCGACGSTNVSDATCIEHLACGYTASIATFELNNFSCPKCGKKLVKEGADYRKIIIRVCHNCGHIARIVETEKVERPAQVERELPSPINLDSWIDYVNDTLKQLELKFVRDYEVKGASGAIHHWDFAIWLFEKELPEIIIKFSLMNSSKRFSNSIDHISNILSIAIKKVDSEILHLILITDYEEVDNLLKTCEKLNIKLVSAEHKKLFTETLEHMIKTIHRSRSD